MIKWYQEVQFLVNIMVSIKLHAFSNLSAYRTYLNQGQLLR